MKEKKEQILEILNDTPVHETVTVLAELLVATFILWAQITKQTKHQKLRLFRNLINEMKLKVERVNEIIPASTKSN